MGLVLAQKSAVHLAKASPSSHWIRTVLLLQVLLTACGIPSWLS